MKSLKMYCISQTNSHLEKIKKLNYIPVSTGEGNFDKGWLRDNTKDHISEKNISYGENTFHYWLWKNDFKENFNAKWIGFCQYRRFWHKNNVDKEFKGLNQSIIDDAAKEWNEHEVVLGNEYYVNNTKLSKIFKHGKKQLIKNPFVFLSKKKMTIKVHFDMYHGFGNLDKAIDLLDKENREDFRNFVNSECSFNPFNMFICSSPEILNSYYSSLFLWLKRCEEIFGFDKKKSYGLLRIYAFLAERYLGYWFKKNSNYILWPIIQFDISNV